MTLVWVEGISGRRVSVALGRLDGLKLHCLPFRLATYVGISVCRNFFLLPVSVASPLNNITLDIGIEMSSLVETEPQLGGCSPDTTTIFNLAVRLFFLIRINSVFLFSVVNEFEWVKFCKNEIQNSLSDPVNFICYVFKRKINCFTAFKFSDNFCHVSSNFIWEHVSTIGPSYTPILWF